MSDAPGGTAANEPAAVVQVDQLFNGLPLPNPSAPAPPPASTGAALMGGSRRPTSVLSLHKKRASTGVRFACAAPGGGFSSGALVAPAGAPGGVVATGASAEDDPEVALLSASPDEAAARAAIAQEKLIHAVRNLSLILLLVVLLLLAFTVSVVYGLYHFLGSMTSALESIQDTLSPATLRRAVSSVQGSLDNVYNTTGNIFNVSESAEVLADKMIMTINNTATLMAHANAMGQQLLAHPTVTLALGGGSANGEL